MENWAWVQSKDNPGDMGTHGANLSGLCDLDETSSWKLGHKYDYREDMPNIELVRVCRVNKIKVTYCISNIAANNSFNILPLTQSNSEVPRKRMLNKLQMKPSNGDI